MSTALHLLLTLASCSLLQGMLLQPRHVRLEAQNFHVWLWWEPDPSLPSHATYQVEWRKRTSSWTKADCCSGNSTSSWVCELYFDRIYDVYWARVRAVAGGEQSKWARSSELQLYRDTTVGPPKLSWLLEDQILTVNIAMPLTPYQRRTGSYKPVDRVLLKLWYWLHLYEGDQLVQQVPCKRSSMPCTFRYLKPRTRYCVRTAAADMDRERSREAEQCLETPAGPTGFSWTLAVLTAFSLLLLLLCVASLCIVQLYIFPNPSEIHLPKTLALLKSELSVAICVSSLELEEDPVTLVLQTVLPSHGPPAAGQRSPMVPLLLRSLTQNMSGYCANGFGLDCPKGRDLSPTHSQLGHTLGSRVPPQKDVEAGDVEKDGEAGDGDDVLEQLVPLGLTRNSYMGDRDNQTPETWLPLHPQLYSKCQCPALQTGSHHPLPMPGRSCSQEGLHESPGTAQHHVLLNSVKLLTCEEEKGGQLLCAPQPLHGSGTELGDSTVQQGYSEQVALAILSPCQPPPLPHNVLQAAAFSGYEPRAPSGT